MISADLLLHAYRQSVFPMAMDDGEIAWFSPDPRASFRSIRFTSHGLKRAVKRGQFEIRLNGDFAAVIRNCAARKETWINEEIIEATATSTSSGTRTRSKPG
jgi:leucyl/phenylalanyl-tRNA--protein transferase